MLPVTIIQTAAAVAQDPDHFNESFHMIFVILGGLIVGILWPIILVVLIAAAGCAIFWAIAGIYQLIRWLLGRA